MDLAAVSVSDFNDFEVGFFASSRSFVDALLNRVAISFFSAASYLTDPICKTHECYRRIYVVDALNPQASKMANVARKVALVVSVVGWGCLATIITMPGVILRSIGAFIQRHPFVYYKGEAKEKELSKENAFTLLSWNICCVGGGYTISDGGVRPWSFRIDHVIDKIIEKDADVNCLYETFDTQSAFRIRDRLKDHGYVHFYFNIGPKAIGVSSGIFVASKYKIENPEFTQFPLDSLVGRTKNAAKGVFAFDLVSKGNSFARIYSTHLQHSELPEFPTREEVEGRRKQMQIIMDKIHSVRDRCVILTGDLNLDDEEYAASSWKDRFEKYAEYQEKTWGGDEFCALMVGKPISSPLNLDHTMMVKSTGKSISTSLVDTGFDSTTFKKEALSDHAGLLSYISI